MFADLCVFNVNAIVPTTQLTIENARSKEFLVRAPSHQLIKHISNLRNGMPHAPNAFATKITKFAVAPQADRWHGCCSTTVET